MMPTPGFGWCAWCGDVITREHVDDHGARYHVACYTVRDVVIGRTTLAPELEDPQY